MRKIKSKQARKKRWRKGGHAPRQATRRPARRRKRGSVGDRRRPRRAVGARAFPAGIAKLGREGGCAATIIIVERAGRGGDKVLNTVKVPSGGAGSWQRTAGGGRLAPRGGRGSGGVPRPICQAFSTLGHVLRAKIVRKLLEGPATYQALKRLTKLKVGPLYHHVNQLRLAGIILPKQRDLYELTRGGRNLILAAMALAPLTRDLRRRPYG
jgi:DNA-binding HxlR family transcriptional regulator